MASDAGCVGLNVTLGVCHKLFLFFKNSSNSLFTFIYERQTNHFIRKKCLRIFKRKKLTVFLLFLERERVLLTAEQSSCDSFKGTTLYSAFHDKGLVAKNSGLLDSIFF